MNASEVLGRYMDEQLPEFLDLPLESIEQPGRFGNRPLHVACVRGDMDEVRALVDAGAELGARGEMGNTPLHEAVGQRHLTVVEYLLGKGADPNTKNEDGNSPIDIARLMGRDEMLAALLASPR